MMCANDQHGSIADVAFAVCPDSVILCGVADCGFSKVHTNCIQSEVLYVICMQAKAWHLLLGNILQRFQQAA